MPSSAVFYLMVVLWLVSAAWHVTVVEMPHWFAGDPPATGIALSDETTAGSAPSLFSAWFNGEKVLTGKLSLEFIPENDSFSLQFDLTSGGKKTIPGRLLKLNANLALERAGTLLSSEGEIDQGLAVHRFSLVRLGRTVQAEQSFETKGLAGLSGRLPVRSLPWKVVSGRPVICPFVPSWRWPDLYCGQKWISTLVDPVGDILRGNQGDLSGTTIVCEVASEMETPPRTLKQPPCHRIDASTIDLSISVWVLPKTGKVVAQRLTLSKDEIWEFIIEEMP